MCHRYFPQKINWLWLKIRFGSQTATHSDDEASRSLPWPCQRRCLQVRHETRPCEYQTARVTSHAKKVHIISFYAICHQDTLNVKTCDSVYFFHRVTRPTGKLCSSWGYYITVTDGSSTWHAKLEPYFCCFWRNIRNTSTFSVNISINYAYPVYPPGEITRSYVNT